MDATSLPIQNPKSKIENSSAPETEQIPEIVQEKTEPPPPPEPKAENINPQSPENKDVVKTEPKLNHPESSSRTEHPVLSTEHFSSLSLSELRAECKKKVNDLKTRQAS
jgi:alpha/beta superfamily hydrolase